MADATLLRNNAIVKNAQVAPTLPHGVVKAGALQLVNIKPIPGGPQVREQPKAVQLLPPKNAEAAVVTGGLPMVQIKNTQNGPQPDDGQDQLVIVRDHQHSTVNAGGLPMVDVLLTKEGRQVQTLPNVQDGPPHIPGAPPVMSQPRVVAPRQGGYVNQGYVARGAAPVVGSRVRIAAPGSAPVQRRGTMESRAVVTPSAPALAAPQPFLPPLPEFSIEQLMLYQHLVGRYITDLTAASARTPVAVPAAEGAAAESATIEGVAVEGTPVEGVAEGASAEVPVIAAATEAPVSPMLQFAQFTLASIEEALIVTAVRTEAARAAAAAPPVAAPVAIQTVAVTAGGSIAPAPAVNHAAATSIAPAPRVSYTAGRVGQARSYTHVGPGGRSQRNAGMAPRHTARGPLPTVMVTMNGERPTVQNQAEVAQARAAAAADRMAGAHQAMPGMEQAVQPGGAAPRGPLPMVMVTMNGERPTVQNQAEVAQARAMAAEQRAAVAAGVVVQPNDLPTQPSDLPTMSQTGELSQE
jgi:hypothetical protein